LIANNTYITFVSVGVPLAVGAAVEELYLRHESVNIFIQGHEPVIRLTILT